MSTIVIPYYTEAQLIFPDTVSDGDEFRLVMPYDGEIIAYEGSIAVLGTGAGKAIGFALTNLTHPIQYFVVLPQILVDSASRVLEGGAMIPSPTFRQGDVLRGFVVAPDVPSGPEDMVIRILCKFYRRTII